MLISEETADRIIGACKIEPADIVFEIGTGEGILTRRLALLVRKVYSYEIDRALCQKVSRTVAENQNVEVIQADAFENEVECPFDVCVTNLPYSQSLRFVKWLSLRSQKFRSAVATLQSEFAQKLLSNPGEASYRAVSVIAQLVFRVEPLFQVGPEAFSPPPKVNSEVVRLSPKEAWVPLAKKDISLLNLLFSFRGRLLSSVARKFRSANPSLVFPQELLRRRIETLTPSEFSLILSRNGGDSQLNESIYPYSEDSALLGEAISKVAGGDLFLEVGFGGGTNLNTVAVSRFEEVVGTDVFPLSNFPAKLSPKIELVRADRATCFRDNIFDLVAFNPPYLPAERMDDLAVDGGPHGVEVPLEFLESALQALKRKGKILILLSSLGEQERFTLYCRDHGLNVSEIAEKKLFFETLTVYLVARKENSMP